jgi:hypothetical protein
MLVASNVGSFWPARVAAGKRTQLKLHRRETGAHVYGLPRP